MSTKRTPQEQEAAEKFHREKCITTKWMCAAIVILSIGLIFLITAVGLFNAWELSHWAGAQFSETCYITLEAGQQCVTESCTDASACTRNVYIVRPTDDSTCAASECEPWDNGCTAVTLDGPCDQSTKQPEFATGDITVCYIYEDGDRVCHDSGRLDPAGTWKSQRGTYVALLVVAILLIIVSVVLFCIGGFRCGFRKVEDDTLGETNGTGCYWCMDYDRCCYGEGTGHATVVNPQGKNLPIKDNQRNKKKAGDGGSTNTKRKDYDKQKSKDMDDEESYDEERAGLR